MGCFCLDFQQRFDCAQQPEFIRQLLRTYKAASRFSARAWMCSVVYFGEMLKIKVRIDLGGGNIGVPEQFLNTTQILAGFKQM